MEVLPSPTHPYDLDLDGMSDQSISACVRELKAAPTLAIKAQILSNCLPLVQSVASRGAPSASEVYSSGLFDMLLRDMTVPFPTMSTVRQSIRRDENDNSY